MNKKFECRYFGTIGHCPLEDKENQGLIVIPVELTHFCNESGHFLEFFDYTKGEIVNISKSIEPYRIFYRGKMNPKEWFEKNVYKFNPKTSTRIYRKLQECHKVYLFDVCPIRFDEAVLNSPYAHYYFKTLEERNELSSRFSRIIKEYLPMAKNLVELEILTNCRYLGIMPDGITFNPLNDEFAITPSLGVKEKEMERVESVLKKKWLRRGYNIKIEG